MEEAIDAFENAVKTVYMKGENTTLIDILDPSSKFGSKSNPFSDKEYKDLHPPKNIELAQAILRVKANWIAQEKSQVEN